MLGIPADEENGTLIDLLGIEPPEPEELETPTVANGDRISRDELDRFACAAVRYMMTLPNNKQIYARDLTNQTKAPKERLKWHAAFEPWVDANIIIPSKGGSSWKTYMIRDVQAAEQMLRKMEDRLRKA